MELVTPVSKAELHEVCTAVSTNRRRHSFSDFPQPLKMNTKAVFKDGRSIFLQVRKTDVKGDC